MLVALDADAIWESASDRAGLAPTEPLLSSLAEPLAILTGDLDRARLTAMGTFIAGEEITQALASRLRVERAIGSRGVSAPAPDPPVVIGGLPRSGTTLLQQLFGELSGVWTPRHWQARWPATAREALTEPQRIDEVRRECALRLDGFHKLAPTFERIHPMGVDEPEECNVFLERSLRSIQFAILSPVPTYLEWLSQEDLSSSYEQHRRELSLLADSDDRCHGRPVLKSPAHLLDYAALADAFPGATVIQIRRDPTEVLLSWSALVRAAQGASVRRTFDPRPEDSSWGAFWTAATRTAVRQRTSDLQLRFVTCEYTDLRDAPRETFAALLEVLDLDDCARTVRGAANGRASSAWPGQGPYDDALVSSAEKAVRELRESTEALYEGSEIVTP